MAPYSLQMPEWLVFLRTLCALAEGAAKVVHQAPDSGAAACVLAVLADPQRRVAVMGGRVGMLRSLGSVSGGAVTRFLGGFRGSVSRAIKSCGIDVAVSADGSTLLVSDWRLGAIHTYSIHTGVFLRTIGSPGTGPLQFWHPWQVWVAPDGFVFVADFRNDRIQILTPHYGFHSCVGVGQLFRPAGVCANDDVVIVSNICSHRLSVFGRHSGELIRCFASFGGGGGLCFMAGRRHVAVVDHDKRRVSVFTIHGEFVRHVGVGKLLNPCAVACSDGDELVVADRGSGHVFVFSASGEIVWVSETTAAGLCGVTIYGSTILGQSDKNGKCFVIT